MARMYPEHLPEDSPSEAERQVFEALRDGLDDHYVVFAQVAWLTPDREGRPRDGEADLLVAHPDLGVLVIEVKGGVIGFNPASGWTSNGLPIKDPVTQATRAMYELRDRVRNAPATRAQHYEWGRGVWFPHVDAGRLHLGPAAPDEIVLDAEDLAYPSEAIERLYAYWMPESSPPGPGAAGVEALVQLLGHTWTLRPLLGPSIRREAETLRTLTEQQFSLLRVLARRPRALIAGCAGSGKTVLALEKARRLASAGFTTLFTCFNKQLAAEARAALAGADVEVVHFHELCYRLGREAGVDLPAREVPFGERSFFTETLPEALSEAARRLGPRYDAVVVDEGQDFEDTWWVPLLELLRDADRGVLYIFYDEHQRIYAGGGSWPIDEEPYVLDVNCRSTRAIHRAVLSSLDGTLSAECLGPEGRAPEQLEVGPGESERALLRKVLHRLVQEEQVRPEDIVVLTPRGQARSGWADGQQLGNLRLSWKLEADRNSVQIASIQAFKGLERPVVILTELSALYPQHRRLLLYIARSRATNHLIEIASPGS